MSDDTQKLQQEPQTEIDVAPYPAIGFVCPNCGRRGVVHDLHAFRYLSKPGNAIKLNTPCACGARIRLAHKPDDRPRIIVPGQNRATRRIIDAQTRKGRK